jgi:hypothetical protein
MSEPTEYEEHEHHEDDAHHIVGPPVYVVILIALLIGTALTVWASFIDLGFWNPIIALAIATTKATLVVPGSSDQSIEKGLPDEAAFFLVHFWNCYKYESVMAA